MPSVKRDDERWFSLTGVGPALIVGPRPRRLQGLGGEDPGGGVRAVQGTREVAAAVHGCGGDGGGGV